LGRVDHLVWSAPDLAAGIRHIERLTGVRAAAGGSHPGVGTRNALLSLGNRRYLEIIGPDPEQAEYRSPRVFQLDNIVAPRLVTWAANSTDLAGCAGMSFPDGQSLGRLQAMSRRRTDGVSIDWRMTDPYVEIDGGVVPFLIDWGDTAHPAAGQTSEIELAELGIFHPDPPTVASKLHSLKIELEVTRAATAGLVAVLDSPAGRVELR